MNVKGGTQTWSSSQQRTDFKSDGLQTVSAADKEKLLGGEDLGETLNKVADPNYVDTSKKLRMTGNNQLGKDAFMTLLLTQMKNQDPTNPLKSHEMAAQLAQFTSLEKLNNINLGIENLRKDAQPDHNLQALSFIGKTVTTDNSKVSHTEATDQHEIHFTLPQDSANMTVSIKDSSGTVVRKLEYKNLKTGKNEITWNGKTDEGTTAAVGEYTADFDAKASNGRKLFVESKVEGLITGVNFTSKGPLLMIGKQAVAMGEVKTISDSNLKQPESSLNTGAQNAPAQGGPGLPASAIQQAIQQAMAKEKSAAPSTQPAEKREKAEVKPETKTNAATRNKLSQGSINDLAMTQDFINKLNKSGAKAGM
jgi:flagellar basal-body rod modification protein FlgD